MAKQAKKLCNFRLPEKVIGVIKQLAEDEHKSQSEVVETAVTLLASGRAFGVEHVRLPSSALEIQHVASETRNLEHARLSVAKAPFKSPLLKPKDK